MNLYDGPGCLGSHLGVGSWFISPIYGTYPTYLYPGSLTTIFDRVVSEPPLF